MKSCLSPCACGLVLLAVLAGCVSPELDDSQISSSEDELSWNFPGTYMLHPRVFLIIYDPSYSGTPLHDLKGWSDPKSLTNSLRSALAYSSHYTVDYVIYDIRVITDRLPWFEGGWRYTLDELVAILNEPDPIKRDQLRKCTIPGNESTCPRFDYVALSNEFNLKGLVEGNSVDEVWVMAPPYVQMYESRMLGTNAYWCNAPAETGVTSFRNFVVMGYNYERQLAEALHSYGHRAESILNRAYRNEAAGHLWDRFRYLNKDQPGQGGVGTVHFPVNGTANYDYGNTTAVSSNGDAWLGDPLVDPDSVPRRYLSCYDWGCTHTGYLEWWYRHMPHGLQNSPNWWRHIVTLEDTPVTSRPDTCGLNTTVSACSNAGCAWYACSNSCWAYGTDIHEACPGDSWCGQFNDAATCDANGCAFYYCSNSCWSKGTDLGVACGPCVHRNTQASCEQTYNSCGWYTCTNTCWPRGTSNNVACDPCRSYDTSWECDAHATSCAWYACTSGAYKCWQRGTALSTACPATY